MLCSKKDRASSSHLGTLSKGALGDAGGDGGQRHEAGPKLGLEQGYGARWTSAPTRPVPELSGGASYAREWGPWMGWHARLGPATPSVHGGLGKGRDLLGFERWGAGEQMPALELQDSPGTGLIFWEQTLLCSARVADGGVEAAPRPPAGRGDRCYSCPSPVTRHPAVKTPVFLEQPACPQAAWAATSQQTGPLIRPGLLGPSEMEVGPEAALAVLSRESRAHFSLPLFKFGTAFSHSSNPPSREGFSAQWPPHS